MKGIVYSTFAALISCIFVLVPAVSADIIYVDDDADTGGDGTTWNTAYKYLQDALVAATSGDTIRVAQGTYQPDEDSTYPDGSDSRTATFQLISGVELYGGYAGLGDTRDIELYPTILSGDLNENDGPDFANNDENSYHVVTGSGCDTTAVLDGFTITDGNANGDLNHHNGAGMYNEFGSPKLTSCTFIGNSTANNIGSGGGMYNDSSSPALAYCSFINNKAMDGGGMINGNSNPILTNCIFTGNRARTFGGGMYNAQSSPTLTNCNFSDNTADYMGGGMSNRNQSNPNLTNCIFNANSATGSGSGGGMQNLVYSHPALANCIFINNDAQYGGGIYNRNNSSSNLINCTFSGNSAVSSGGAIFCLNSSNALLTNCILWDDGDEFRVVAGSTITVSYSCVQDADPDDTAIYPGIGNIDENPMFVHPYSDFHLRHTIKPQEIPDFNPAAFVRSPCINAGDNSVVTELYDLDGDTRIQDGWVDMGCYESPSDTDIDGMADEWEVDNFGDIDAANNDDPDTDGLINIGEYVLGFDPMYEFNVKTFIRKDGSDTAILLWNSAATHQYKLWECDDLSNWTISEDWQAGTGSWIYQPKSMLGLDKMFYRVEYEPIP